jgi:hypothetical protein
VAGPARTFQLLLLAFAAPLAGGVACVALGLLFGLKGGKPCGFFFFFAGELGCRLRRGLGLPRHLLGLGGLARFLGLGARGGLRLALGLTLLDLGIVRSRLGAEFVQNVLLRLLRRLLTIGKTWFLESTHKRGLVAFNIGCGTRDDGFALH